ncbi:exo-alpha-sialidase [Phycisphaerales bacterium AB-hyl4]|uniref:Exo-alpha-sialidase n=1 Tax=Natronomicrosphaera hydrolytica TaxID=3242702 RepID=A0ABV4UB44_9BACT
MTSLDGVAWESAALLSKAGRDLRDPKLSITPDDRLMLLGCSALRDGVPFPGEHQAVVSFSEDGSAWSEIEPALAPQLWLWRVTWHRGRGYGLSFSTTIDFPQHARLTLHATDDGLTYHSVVEDLGIPGCPSEASLRFDQDDTAYALVRRDSPKHTDALLGRSRPPYTQWQWHELDVHIGGPNLLQLPDGRWIGAGRVHADGKPYTTLGVLDMDQGRFEPRVRLVTSDDSSYPGLLWHDQRLWVSYYSGNGGKASIYLAQLTAEQFD